MLKKKKNIQKSKIEQARLIQHDDISKRRNRLGIRPGMILFYFSVHYLLNNNILCPE